MFKGIDLSSDTATKPSKAMLTAMMNAEVGDEQKSEDPTTKQLEELVADMFGFTQALFFPSATMANEIALRHFCDRGDDLIAAQNCHLFMAETGGPAVHANVMCKPIPTETGIFTAESIRKQFNYLDHPNFPISKLVSVENTSNFGGGIPWSKEELKNVIDCADEHGLKKHMDGSRVFNASVKTNLSVDVIADGFDAVTLCLSKGLGCPTGALLIFDKIHYPAIRRLKQLMGGSMRQSGILAAAGIYALKNNIARLADDHDNANQLANRLANIPNIRVLNNPPATNIIYFELNLTKIIPESFDQACIGKGVRFSMIAPNKFRAITHLDISNRDIKKTAEIVSEIISRK